MDVFKPFFTQSGLRFLFCYPNQTKLRIQLRLLFIKVVTQNSPHFEIVPSSQNLSWDYDYSSTLSKFDIIIFCLVKKM